MPFNFVFRQCFFSGFSACICVTLRISKVKITAFEHYENKIIYVNTKYKTNKKLFYINKIQEQ